MKRRHFIQALAAGVFLFAAAAIARAGWESFSR